MTDDLASIQAAIDAGDPVAAERLLPLVYEELRRLAAAHMRREAPGASVQATELVHEAYLRLLGPAGTKATDWKGREPFLAAAAQSMRRILIERARSRGAQKRGGGRRRLDLVDFTDLSVDDVPVEVLDLDAALTKLSVEHPAKAELVSLRFFGGLTLKEAAAVLGVSTNTADRHWAFARAWLLTAMEDEHQA